MDAVKTEFAEAAERHLDDVHAYLVYLTGDRATAEELTAETFARALERWHRFDPRRAGAAHLALPARALDGARPLSRRGAAAPARGPLRRRRAARGGAGLRRRAVPGAGRRARAALGGRARGRRAARGARARRRGRRAGARDQRDGVLDAAQPCPAEAGEGGERRCRRLSSSVTSIASRRSCALRGPSPRPRCASAWPHSARPSPRAALDVPPAVEPARARARGSGAARVAGRRRPHSRADQHAASRRRLRAVSHGTAGAQRLARRAEQQRRKDPGACVAPPAILPARRRGAAPALPGDAAPAGQERRVALERDQAGDERWPARSAATSARCSTRPTAASAAARGSCCASRSGACRRRWRR